jgi:hypothetical protein
MHNAEKGGRFATPPMPFRVMAWPRLISLTEKAPLLRKAQKWATRGTLQRGMNSSAERLNQSLASTNWSGIVSS